VTIAPRPDARYAQPDRSGNRSKLLCCQELLRAILEHGPEDDVGKLTLKAAHGLVPGLALGALALHVLSRGRVLATLRERDDEQRPVQLTIAAPVEAHALRLA